MKYERFERYAVAFAALVVAAMITASARDFAANMSGILSEVLLFIIFLAAIHYGRRGGLLAAIACSAVYVLASIPGMTADRGLTSEMLLLVATRVFIFGVVGILGGEACGRLRIFFARAANGSIFDEWSQAFNQTYAHAALTRSIASFERYGQQFTIAVITLSPSLTADLGPQRVRNVVRGVAKHLRNDVRMVDEVALLNDGRFLVLFPNTPVENAATPATRLARGARQLLGAKDESITARCLGPVDDLPALKALVAEIAPERDESEGQSESGEYSSAGERTRNPA